MILHIINFMKISRKMKIKYCWKNKNLLDDENTKTELLRQKSKWYSQLIMFELNRDSTTCRYYNTGM